MSRRHGPRPRAGATVSGVPRTPTSFVVVATMLTVALACYRLFVLVPGRQFNTDELEHLQSAWMQTRGLMMYRDFFEHHPPLLYLLLAPLRYLRDDTVKIFAARYLLVPFSLASIVLAAHIASKRGGRLAGSIAALLMSSLVVFQQKSIECRPDVPALFFLLVALALAVSNELTDRRRVIAAASFSVALLFTPKVLFAAPAIMLFGLSGIGVSENRFRRIFAVSLGLAVPMGAAIWYLAANHALGAAWYFNVEFNLRVPFTFRLETISTTVNQTIAANWAFWLVTTIATIAMLRSAMRSELGQYDRRWSFIVGGTAAGLAAGFLIIPVPLPQYLMLMSAPLCVVAAVHASAWIETALRSTRTVHAISMLAVATTIAQPLPALMRDRRDTATSQIHSLKETWSAVPRDARVFDCWTGRGLFRRPAYFYQFLGPDIIGVLETTNMAEFQRSLLDAIAAHQPYIINAGMIMAVPDDVIAFVQSTYVDIGGGILAYQSQR